jgi:hypothetical protein
MRSYGVELSNTLRSLVVSTSAIREQQNQRVAFGFKLNTFAVKLDELVLNF